MIQPDLARLEGLVRDLFKPVDYDLACEMLDAINALPALLARVRELEKGNAGLAEALEPFAAMGRVMEARAMITFGRCPPDGEIVCESSGEVGTGILVMGHFRDAAALLPKAPGWGGMYKPLARAALTINKEPTDAG